MLLRRAAPAALVLTAALALTACTGGAGGADDGPSVSSTASSSASASASGSASTAPVSDPQVVAAFCEARNGPLTALSQQLQSAGPDQLPVLVPQLVTALDAVQPPTEVAADFKTFRDGMAALGGAVQGVDPAGEEFQQRVAAVGQQYGQKIAAADEGLGTWSQAHCPATASPSASASATG